MIKQIRAYRTALAALADDHRRTESGRGAALRYQVGLDDVMERRHPDFMAAMNAAILRRKQVATEKRRAELKRRKATA